MDLRGASADSLRELTTEVGGALRAGSHAEQVAGELFTVAQLMRDEPALRRVATDAALPAEPSGARSTRPRSAWSRRRRACDGPRAATSRMRWSASAS
jgi:hypothetical protein